MDREDHRATLARVERELVQLLDDSAGQIGHAITLYRSALWDARSTVRAASVQLEKIQGGHA